MTSLILSLWFVAAPPPKAPPVVPDKEPAVKDPQPLLDDQVFVNRLICQDGVCRVISGAYAPLSPQGQATTVCPGGVCPPQMSAPSGWYPGKLLGRRR